MTPPIFALDACVLVSSALRDTLLRAAEANFYSPRWSEIILEEVRRTLVNKQFTDEQRAQHLLVTLRSVFPRAMVTGFEQHIDAMTNHPKDRHVVAAAIEARATRIITRNVRDFPARALAPYGIRAQRPDDLRCEWQRRRPADMLAILRAQGAFLRPQRAVGEVISTLADQGAPRFAALARRSLAESQPGEADR